MDYKEENDRALDAIQGQVEKLQGKLKERLEETHKLDDLSKKVSDTSFHLRKSTQKLEKTSEKTRWLLMLEMYKWYIAIGIIVLFMIFSIIRTFK